MSLEQTLLPEGNRRQETPKDVVELVKAVELVIEEPDTAVANTSAVRVNSHNASVATQSAVLDPWWHDAAARLTVRELADLGNLASIFTQSLFLLFVEGSTHFMELDIFFGFANNELGRCLVLGHLNVPHNCAV